MSDRVFISYSRQDVDPAGRAVVACEAAGYDVWVDQLDIEASVSWRAEIEGGIRGAVAMLCIATDRWRSSPACQEELEFGERLHKKIAFWDGLGDPHLVIAKLRDDLDDDVFDGYRAQGLVQSFRWNRSGRSKHLLATGEMRKILRHLSAGEDDDDLLREYYRASKSLHARRLMLRMLGATATIVLFAGSRIVANVTEELVDDVQDDFLQRVSVTRPLADLETQPWAAISAVVKATGPRSDIDDLQARLGLTPALSLNLPEVVEDLRTAPPSPDSLTITHEPLEVIVDQSRVIATEKGVVHAQWSARGHVTATTYCSDEEWVVFADSAGVHAHHVEDVDGYTLSGAVGSVRQLECLADGRVAADTDKSLRFIWKVRPGVTRVASTGLDLRHLAQNERGQLLAVTEDGDSAVIVDSRRQGHQPVRLRAPGRPVAVVSAGESWLLIRDDDGSAKITRISRTREVDVAEVGDCSPVDSLVKNDQLVIACFEGAVVSVDLAGRIGPRSQVDAQLLSLSTWQDEYAVAGGFSDVYTVSPGDEGRLIGLWIPCLTGAAILSESPTGDFLVGLGASPGVCHSIRSREDPGGIPHKLPFTFSGHGGVRALAWRDGTNRFIMATGLGQILVGDLDTFRFTQVSRVATTAVHGVEFISDDRAVAITQNGGILEIDLTVSTMGVDEQIAELRSRLDVARRAGIIETD